jgi:hypothetical protein
MNTVASFSSVRPAEVIAAPSARDVHTHDAPQSRRSRAKKLTFVNRSTRLGKRIDELKALYTSAFPAEALTQLRLEAIANAAQLQALAEHERGLWMRGEARCDLDELVRLERKADQAVRALRIKENGPREAPALADYLAQRVAAKAAAGPAG